MDAKMTWDDRYDIRAYVEWRRKTQKMGWDRPLCLDRHHHSRLTEATVSECGKYDLDPELIRNAVVGLAPRAADELALQLLERHLVKEELEARGEKQLVRWGKVMPDSLINELALIVLGEFCEAGDAPPPISLLNVFRAQLKRKDDPSYLPDAMAVDKQHMAAALMAASPQMSARKIAKIVGVLNTTVSRWLKSPEFRAMIASARKQQAD